MMNPPMPTLASVSTRRRVERLTGCAAAVGLGVMLGVGVVVGVGVGVSIGTVAVGVAVNVAVGVGPGGVNVAVAVAVAVIVAVGVGDDIPQVPWMLNTMCMFGNPSVAVSVGVVTPQSTALR
jgi:hypothetical protein